MARLRAEVAQNFSPPPPPPPDSFFGRMARVGEQRDEVERLHNEGGCKDSYAEKNLPGIFAYEEAMKLHNSRGRASDVFCWLKIAADTEYTEAYLPLALEYRYSKDHLNLREAHEWMLKVFL